MMTMLRLVGYDYVLSIEHEDALASVEEGLRKSIESLRLVMLKDPPAEMWWA